MPTTIYNNVSQDISYSLKGFSKRIESRGSVGMKGGRLRGKGTYGCVFQPALLCRGSNKQIDPNKVGKITDYVDAKNELSFGKYFKTIPESNKYVIYAEPTACIPLSKSKQVDKDIESCKLIDEQPLSSMVQIVMPWGGIPLSRINLDPTEFNYLDFMQQILEIGTFLILKDVCHFDISGPNILFDKNKQPRIIDFGFAFRPEKFTSNDISLRWREIGFDHDTETPEVTLMLAAHQAMDVEEAIEALKQQKPAVLHMASLCGVSPEVWAKDLHNWTLTSHSFQVQNWESCWKTYWPGFDSWSIGALLLNILDIQMHFPSFMESDLWKAKATKIKKVLTGMCRAHPAYRIDAAEALAFLTDGKHPLISKGGSDGYGNNAEGYVWIQEKKDRRQGL